MSNVTSLSRSFLLAVVVSGLSVVGCGSPGSDDEGSTGVTQASLAEFDGESLFVGLVMMDGEVGNLIPEIREHFSLRAIEMSEEQRNEVSESQQHLLAIIREIEPKFFKNFEKMIRSGEHATVDKALEEAGRVLLWAARYSSGPDRFAQFFEEYGPLDELVSARLPERYEGGLHPSLAEFIKGNLLTIDGRMPRIPEHFSRFERGLALDAAVDVNWFLDRVVKINFILDINRSRNLVRTNNDHSWDRLDNLMEFQSVIREKMIDSIVYTFRY